jgi:hypothetical protein
LAAVAENVSLFQDLGRTGQLDADAKLPLTLGIEDHLSIEIFQRATHCRILLKYMRLRTSVCNLLLLVGWPPYPSAGSRMLTLTGAPAGDDLVTEYRQLIEVALAFSRMKGDFYYENLLSAL